MDENSSIVKGFNQNEVRRLGCWALFIFLIMEITISSLFHQPAILKLHQIITSRFELWKYKDNMGGQHTNNKLVETFKSISNYSNSRSDSFDITGDIRVHSNSTTIFVDLNMNSWIIRPYARKYDKVKIKPITDWNVQTSKNYTKFPVCHKHFNVPAILFSAGSFAGNYFHSFADVLFPLYITSRQFNRTVILLISNYQGWWIEKFKLVLEKLTKYDLVDIDQQNEVLCFDRLILGLKSDKELVVDPKLSPNYSIKDFRQFLRETYSLQRKTIDDYYKNCSRKPRLLIISRKHDRRLSNEREIAELARNNGANVSIGDLQLNVLNTARYVNSFDVLIGVHGAGLTNILFLPDDAVFVQIIPFGLDDPSQYFFGQPSREMNLRYMEYKVSLSESSLLRKYSPGNSIYTNPYFVRLISFTLFHKIYLTDQDVTIDLYHFRETLVNTLKLVQCHSYTTKL